MRIRNRDLPIQITNLLPNPEACGRLRQIAVGIGGSVYSPLSTPQLLDEYFQIALDTAAAINDPFEQSFFTLVISPICNPSKTSTSGWLDWPQIYR